MPTFCLSLSMGYRGLVLPEVTQPQARLGQGRPDHTHVLLLPLLMALVALTHGPPDAGIQAMANHMNQLC